MAVAEKEYRKAKGKRMFPAHEVIEKDGRRVYSRRERAGNLRSLAVWHIDSCRKKVREKMAAGTITTFLDNLYQLLAEYSSAEGGDPMLAAWFGECVINCEKAFDEMVAPPATILEDFGSGFELEEFGT